MAAPTWSHEYTAELSSNAGSISASVNGSSEFAVGDLILAFVTTDGDTSASLATSGLTNMIERYATADTGSGNDVTIGCFTKELVSGDTSVTTLNATWTGTEKAALAVYRVPKAEHNGLVEDFDSSANSASSTPSLPAITLPTGNNLVFGQCGMDANVTVSTNPTGYATTEAHSATGGSNCNQWIGEDVLGGSQSANSLTITSARNNCTGIIAVMEAGNYSDWLIESWELDQSSGNETGSHDSHVLTDNNTVGAGTGLVYSNARDFDASASEYFSLANASAADFDPGTSDFAVSFWVKPESGHTSTDGIISYGGNGASSAGYRIGYNSDNDIGVFVADGTDFHSYDTAPELTDGSWSHVVVNFNRDDGLSVFVDDSPTSQINSSLANISGDNLQPSDDLQIGRTRTADYTDGLIGPVRVWNQCLGPAAREYLYNSGSGRTYSAMTGGGGSAITKIVDETLTLNSTAIRNLGLVRFANTTLNLNEEVRRLMGMVRLQNETLTLTTNPLRVLGLVRAVNELVSILEGTRWIRGLYRIVNEVLTIVEVLVRTITSVGPGSVTAIVNEVVSLLNQNKKVLGLLRFKNETLTINETPRLVRGIYRIVNETVNISTSVVKVVAEAVNGMVSWAEFKIEPKVRIILDYLGAKLEGKLEDEDGRTRDI